MKKLSAGVLARFGDPDATHSLRARRPARIGIALPAMAVLTIAGIVFCVGLRHRATPIGGSVQILRAADEETLLANPAPRLTLYRFAAAPHIVVAVFPSLHAQALALNRVAAFIERAGAPRDAVLSDTALRATIGQSALAFDTYYYGHDYRAADLARFYATAAADGVVLNEAETTLHRQLAAAGFFGSVASGALISLPPQGSGLLDPSARAAILYHELSHGAYFTDPAYAAYVAAFWRNLTAAERAAFRQFLGGEGYDTADEDLMRNETQAYLVFTADPRMFDPARLGLPEASTLRSTFLQGLPVAWLRRDATLP